MFAIAGIFSVATVHAGDNCESKPGSPACYLPAIAREIQSVSEDKTAGLLRDWLERAYLSAAGQALEKKDFTLAEQLISGASRGRQRDFQLTHLVIHYLQLRKPDQAIGMLNMMEKPRTNRNIRKIIAASRGVDPLVLEALVRAYERSLDEVEDIGRRASLYDGLARILLRYKFKDIAKGTDEILQSLVLQDSSRIKLYIRRRVMERYCAEGDFYSAYLIAASFRPQVTKMKMLKWVASRQMSAEGFINSSYQFDRDSMAEIALDARLNGLSKSLSPDELVAIVRETLPRVESISSARQRNFYYAKLVRLLLRKSLYEDALRINQYINDPAQRMKPLYSTLKGIYRKHGIAAALEMANRINSREAEFFVYAIAVERSRKSTGQAPVSEYLQRLESLLTQGSLKESGVQEFGRLFLVNAYMEMERKDEAIAILQQMNSKINDLVKRDAFSRYIVQGVVSMYTKLDNRDMAIEFLAKARKAALTIADQEKRKKLLSGIDIARRRISNENARGRKVDIREILQNKGRGLGGAMSRMYRNLASPETREAAITELVDLVPLLAQKGYQIYVYNSLKRLVATRVANAEVIRLLDYLDKRKRKEGVFRLLVRDYARGNDVKGFLRLVTSFPKQDQLKYLSWALETLATGRRKPSADMLQFHQALWSTLSSRKNEGKYAKAYFLLALRQSRFYPAAFHNHGLERLMARMIADPTDRLVVEVAVGLDRNPAISKVRPADTDKAYLSRIGRIKKAEWRAYALLLYYHPFAIQSGWERDWTTAMLSYDTSR